MITIKIADIPIGLDCRFEYTEKVVAAFKTDEPPLFTVSASDADIELEYEYSGVRTRPEYTENVVMYRKIAEKLPDYDAVVFHGVMLELDGVAYAITAHSGVGKTTHSRLWLEKFPDKVKILNGDKPIIRLINGTPYACSTPWMGKEHYGYNAMRPLGAIGFLSRGTVNKSRKISVDGAVVKFMNQVYLAKGNGLMLARSMRICDSILSTVPLYELECNMSPDAPLVSYDAFVNSKTTD
ncbi:MAG: hypothetical protein IJ515_04990 [Clostridia bacterium]|nr:hypothetical protein [Clostridia bacterium]